MSSPTVAWKPARTPGVPAHAPEGRASAAILQLVAARRVVGSPSNMAAGWTAAAARSPATAARSPASPLRMDAPPATRPPGSVRLGPHVVFMLALVSVGLGF